MSLDITEVLLFGVMSAYAAALIGALLGDKLAGLLNNGSAQRLNGPDTKAPVNRRKMESNPNLICSLPMHDVPRREAPLY